MAKTKTAKRQKDIKSKLIAAICMLLVSTIMMVSSTYAWFTLSTAPEVTGITTAVGANGNLEMALLPADATNTDLGIDSEVGDGNLDLKAKNTTWGNLVTLKDAQGNNVYGMDKITLFPSQLYIPEGFGSAENPQKLNVSGSILSTPKYGADGRITELVHETLTGIYEDSAFQQSDKLGVRAVGTASGMTDRQLAYRNALSAGSTAKGQAANKAKETLDTKGSDLANIAIKYGMDNTNAKFTVDDVKALKAMIAGLEDSLDLIEEAYIQYFVALATSSAGVADTADGEIQWKAIQAEAEKENITLETFIAFLETNGFNFPDTAPVTATTPMDILATYVYKYYATRAAVTAAATELNDINLDDPDATFDWATIRTPMTKIADTTAMKINGFKASEVKQNISQLVSSVTSQGGLTVVIETGGGAFADVADHCGDYWASVNIESVEYQGVTLNDMKARMETKSTYAPKYHLVVVDDAVRANPAPSSGSDNQPITDMYGFIVDLAFRTNAAESKLVLQADAADRIYEGNTNEETMGHGSSMTFKATTTDFNDDQVKELMKAIRIVFFDPFSGNVVALAKLDVANATSGTDGITAKIVLYTVTEADVTEYKEVTGELPEGTTRYNKKVEYVAAADGTYVSDGDGYKLADGTEPEGTTKYAEKVTWEASATGTHYAVVTKGGTHVPVENNEIMALTQNTAHALSVLVYLDGNLVGNDDVAATAATSMTGSMNLQFASTANLVPMEYADLHIPGADADDDGE